jgi:ActR/RegA family two-component response regulator
MNAQKRVLIVEDEKSLLRTYVDIASSAGYAVAGVSNMKEAIAAIYNNSYHVAIVDIQLNGEGEHEGQDYNRDGLSIIEYLHNLGEGTEIIILSALNEVEVAIQAYERFGIAQYLRKRKAKKASDIIAAIDRAYEKCRLNEYGNHNSITSFLAGSNVMSWEHKCLSILHPTEGMKGLNAFFVELCKPFTPLLPRKSTDIPMGVDENKNCVTGEFWSKGIGQAISLTAYPRSNGPEALRQAQADRADGQRLIQQYEKANVVGLVLSLSCPREDFVEHL